MIIHSNMCSENSLLLILKTSPFYEFSLRFATFDDMQEEDTPQKLD